MQQPTLELVRFYDEGWRYGRFVRVERGKALIIHPVEGIKRVDLLDVRHDIDESEAA